MPKHRRSAWSLADRIAELDVAALPPDELAAPLLRQALRDADGIRALEARANEREAELAKAARAVVETEEHRALLAAKKALSDAKKRALDVPEVKEAAEVVKKRKAALDARPETVVAKRIAIEVQELDAAAWERRRAMVRALFERKVIDAAAPTPPISAHAPAAADAVTEAGRSLIDGVRSAMGEPPTAKEAPRG